MTDGTPAHQRRVAPPRSRRHRPHVFPGRPRRITIRFSDDEYDRLATAADQAELTTTGFCAQAVLEAAHPQHTPPDERQTHDLARLQAELFRVRVAVNQIRAELSRTLDTGTSGSPGPDTTTANAAASLDRLDKVISSIDRQLAQRGLPADGRG